jgi:hypothetical protein
VKAFENREAFPDTKTAVEELAKYAKGFAFPCMDKDPTAIARESAESAWLKSLTRRLDGSADAYLRWASVNVPKMAKNARYVINQAQFDILVRKTGTDLLRAWRDASPDRSSRLSFGAGFRIVDMLFWAIDESENCRHDSVRQFLHVPLDATTLKPLRAIVNELLETDFAVEIPGATPAGFVATEEHYMLLQRAISALARRAGIMPILYAYWCAGD